MEIIDRNLESWVFLLDYSIVKQHIIIRKIQTATFADSSNDYSRNVLQSRGSNFINSSFNKVSTSFEDEYTILKVLVVVS